LRPKTIPSKVGFWNIKAWKQANVVKRSAREYWNMGRTGNPRIGNCHRPSLQIVLSQVALVLEAMLGILDGDDVFYEEAKLDDGGRAARIT
jgi:hypothetical protein